MRKRVRLINLWLIVIWGLFGCSANSLLEIRTEDIRVDQDELSSLALELSEDLLQKNIDTVAVLDFTDPLGLVSKFEQDITEQIFLSMAGFSGKLWVVGGDYLDNVLKSQKPPDEVWPVMGVQAIVSGTIKADRKKITVNIRVTEAQNANPIHSIQRKCRVLGTHDELAYLAAPPEELRTRSIQQRSYDIPAFPWPPPEASASIKVPSHFLHNNGRPTTLAQIARRLESAFSQAGYTERNYYSVPGGFALVSRMEQFNPDGSSKPLPERWAVEMTPPKVFSLSSYLKALFWAPKGHFRIISFLVTSVPFVQQSESPVSQEEALEWLSSGAQMLPPALESVAYSDKHYCVALIYEFEQSSRNHAPEFKRLSLLPGFKHLRQARLWDMLEN